VPSGTDQRRRPAGRARAAPGRAGLPVSLRFILVSPGFAAARRQSTGYARRRAAGKAKRRPVGGALRGRRCLRGLLARRVAQFAAQDLADIGLRQVARNSMYLGFL